jgi:prolyl oligopeptidase
VSSKEGVAWPPPSRFSVEDPRRVYACVWSLCGEEREGCLRPRNLLAIAVTIVFFVPLHDRGPFGAAMGRPDLALQEGQAAIGVPGGSIRYPNAPPGKQIDVYHGIEVADPFRWLEEIDSAETREWVAAENELTEAFLKTIPARAEIRERLAELWDYERFGIPSRKGSRYFFTKNDGLQNQAVLYTARGLDESSRPLLDPNGWSPDGTVSLSAYEASEDGRFLAYGVSRSGSDWSEWKVRDIEGEKDLPDLLRWIKFSGVSWSPDGSGFYYSRFDEPSPGQSLEETNYFQKLFYHRLGAPQSEDRLVYERPDQKEWGFGGQVTEDGRFLLIYVSNGTDPKNLIFYEDLTGPAEEVVELIKEFEAAYSVLGNDGPILYVRTDSQAPRGRIVAIDTGNPAREAWREIVPQQADAMDGASLVGDLLFVTYLKDAHSVVKVYPLGGGPPQEIALPGLGNAYGFGGRRKDAETFYAYWGFTIPTTIYRYDLVSGRSSPFRESQVKFDPERFETEQVFYTSKDGTRIPMFLAHQKGIAKDGKNPTYLTGYGGFGIASTPYFSVRNVVWMEMGGLLAVPGIRGGGEYGEEWHQAAVKQNRQRAFDDFIAAAEWLIDQKLTSTAKLAIEGGSNGGTLVGACMTQRPDLFGAALPAAGVLDMIRYTKFTIGWAWTSDFGSPDDPDEFRALRAYSPVHNVRPGTAYPATLITTADHDDRVVPGHSYKFAAALQAAQAGAAPILIRIETEAGHGDGLPTSKWIDESADRLAFLVRVLGME